MFQETAYLQALLLREQGGKTGDIINLLDKAAEIHLKSIEVGGGYVIVQMFPCLLTPYSYDRISVTMSTII